MTNLFASLMHSYKCFVSRKATTAADLWSEKSLRDFFKEIGILLLALATPVAVMSLLVFAAYRFRKTLIMLLLFPVLIASYRANHPRGSIPSSNVDEELARQRARELYPFVLSWMFRVLNAVSSFTGIDRKHDVHEIETASSSGEHFYMDGVVAVYQFELECENEVEPDQADRLLDKLQKYGQKYICEYPMLISPDTVGRSAMEVLAVHPLGHRICIDVVQTTTASVAMIDARRRARVERRNIPAEVPRYVDSDYGDQ